MKFRHFSDQFLQETIEIAKKLDYGPIERAACILSDIRNRYGRLFILGVGGSAANASHAVNDFRKICDIEAYAPTDNVSELPARTNDEGWATVFEAWLKGSRLCSRDVVLVLSVGGGNLEKNVSPNLVKALEYAQSVGSYIIGIVGRDGGYTAKVANECIIIPTVNPDHVTPHSESWQAVIWHLLVSHPFLKKAETKWESTPTNKAVFFDRDGTLTINPKSAPILDVVPAALSALIALKDAGFKIIVVTNQADIGRGITSKESVDAANERLSIALPIDDIYVCPHTDEDNCDCRKPKPGMLLRAARDFDIDLKKSFMVGDTSRDLEAGLA